MYMHITFFNVYFNILHCYSLLSNKNKIIISYLV